MSDHEQGKNDGTLQVPNDPIQMNIQVKHSNGEVLFKIKKTTQFKKVMKAFCERQGKDPHTLRFMFEDTKILKDQAPADLEMEDGDIIHVFEEQLGGG